MPSSSRPGPTVPSSAPGPVRGPSRARVALVVVAVGAATLGGLLTTGWLSAALLGLVVLALAALTLGTWQRLTVPGRGLRVLVLGFLAATAVARLST